MANGPLITKAFASLGGLAAFSLACGSSDSRPSTFGASAAADGCTDPSGEAPARVVPAGTLIRSIGFHVTNDSNQLRWVQTTGDDGCSTFDVVRGGAPLTIVPPALCGCDCKAPEPHTTYTRLAPGESVDLHWDGIEYQLTLICVTGPTNGCADGATKEVFAASGLAAPATDYDGVIHVENSEPPGCTTQGSPNILVCDAQGSAPGRCRHGIGEARFPLVLPDDPPSVTIPVSLE